MDRVSKGLTIAMCVLAGVSGFLSKRDEFKMMKRISNLEKNVFELMSENE